MVPERHSYNTPLTASDIQVNHIVTLHQGHAIYCKLLPSTQISWTLERPSTEHISPLYHTLSLLPCLAGLAARAGLDGRGKRVILAGLNALGLR